MTEEPINKKIQIEYEKDYNYRIIFADDVLVGQTMTRGLTIDFFVGNWVPRTELHVWSPEKKAYDILTPENDVVPYKRTLQVQIIMTPESAEGMIRAINERMKSLKPTNDDKK